MADTNNATPAGATVQESQESIFARNRAIYEASLQQNQQTTGSASNGSNGSSATPGFAFEKQARPRSQDGTPAPATANESSREDGQEPARKKLIRAGDLSSAAAHSDGSFTGSPAVPGSAGLSASNGESMRDKIARARVPPAVQTPPLTSNPFVAQPQYAPPVSASPVNNANGQSQGSSQLEHVVEVNAQAFVTKNPSANINIVKQALRHSRGVFDQNFQTAMQLLQSSTGAAASTPPASGAQQSYAQAVPGQANSGQISPVSQMVLPGQLQAPRYPGQTPAPQGHFPGHAPGQPQLAQSFAPQPTYPHQMPRPAQSISPAMNPSATMQQINGQSAQALAGQTPPQQRSPQSQKAQPQQQMAPPPMPPPIQPGTHPSIGFSALQVLPESQRTQFLQLSHEQQIGYSMSVFNSLQESQRQEFTAQAQSNQRAREVYHAWQQQNASQAGGRANQAVNPYLGYASQLPTQQQQMQQQRFPGQNPVFRVGAPAQAARTQQTQNGVPQAAPQVSGTVMNQQQLHFLQSQQHLLLSQMLPAQRNQFHALPVEQQQAWVWQQVQMRNEATRRQQTQLARVKQQQLMAQSAQNAKQTKATSAAPKKSRKRNRYGSESEDDDQHFTDESEDDEDGDDVVEGSEDEAEREAVAITWFNTTSIDELREMTGCSQEVAEAVIEMRPYAGPGDIRTKLRKRKGVSGNLFDNYVELMLSYNETDVCLKECTDIGQDLLETMNIWTGGRKILPTESMRPSAEPEESAVKNENDGADVKPSGDLLAVPSNAASRAASPSLKSESMTNVGANLIELSADILQQSTAQDASEDVKRAFKGYLYEQPALLKEGVKLKNYQMLGVNWLNLLYTRSISCILADEMGLGKTIQVIAFIAHLKETGAPGPHLVIVPSSTLDNWMREFDRFAPSISVYAYYGNQAERADARYFLKQQKDLDVIVTTYNMATGITDDKKFLKKMEFKACVFDEGHQLKNAESKKYKDLMEIKVKWRLLLTGTPLQNNLQELVSLLSFMLPKVFSEAQESLRAIFKIPPNAHKNLLTRQRISAAKGVMAPFVLRRKKAQVLQDLPPKTEIIEYCEMTVRQRDIYRDTIEKHKKQVIEYNPSGENTPAEKPVKKKGRQAKTAKGMQEDTTSNILMRLRKAANHPMLFRKIYDDKKIKQIAKDCLKEEEFADRNVDYIVEDLDLMTDFEIHRFVTPYKLLGKHALKKNEWMESGKIKKLQEMMPKFKEQGDRVLIFSQFVSVLEIMGQVLQTMDIKYLTLTGQTNVNDRQGLVDEYTEDKDIMVFLLSTRAGGLGLNLAAANVVVILDLDFNPHNDKQAADRAYRMGQTKPVTIYRFITKGSIEEDILSLAETKLALDEQVAGESAISGEQAEKLEIEEGDEGIVEKKVKASLMTTLQKRFQGDDQTYLQDQTNDTEPKVEVTDADADVEVDAEASQE